MRKILSTSIILLIVLAGCSSSHHSVRKGTPVCHERCYLKSFKTKKMKHNGNTKKKESVLMVLGIKKNCLNHYTKRAKNNITQNRRK